MTPPNFTHIGRIAGTVTDVWTAWPNPSIRVRVRHITSGLTVEKIGDRYSTILATHAELAPLVGQWSYKRDTDQQRDSTDT